MSRRGKVSFLLCLALIISFSGSIRFARAGASVLTCDQLDGVTDANQPMIEVGGSPISIKPGQQLLIEILDVGAFGVTFSGPGAPSGLILLPYTFNYADIPSGSVWTLYPAGLGLPSLSIVWHCVQSSESVTWFAPGDGRVDPRPADRIAVWCNTTAMPPALVVYGVSDASRGFWLGTFNNADLLKAGSAGIVKSAGPGNGSVSAQTDGAGNYYVAWTGGSFNATGTGDFAKSFSCGF